MEVAIYAQVVKGLGCGEDERDDRRPLGPLACSMRQASSERKTL